MPIDHSPGPLGDTDDMRLVVQTLYDPDQDDELGTKVVDVVTSLPEVDTDDFWDLPPLYDAVDVDAVERTFFGRETSGVDRLVQGIVSFEYLEHVITVRDDGWIFVYSS
ncbi:HalOD1 output domain-containing protein [Halorubellus litoreus]|uniref:HalOD1 output domain-containing protein n=1 Tax=Halorubellus litoreus TaxID=755308 RepID=A0ABD5VM32_9EURY